MTYSETLVDYIKDAEGLTLVAKHLPGDRPGVITGGYGDTDVKLGESFPEPVADRLLRARLDTLAAEVSRLVAVPLTQGQFNALVDFAYNLGVGALAASTLLHLLNEERYYEADLEFSRWNRAGGQVLAGLVHRRAIESQWFSGALAEV